MRVWRKLSRVQLLSHSAPPVQGTCTELQPSTSVWILGVEHKPFQIQNSESPEHPVSAPLLIGRLLLLRCACLLNQLCCVAGQVLAHTRWS